MHQKILRARAIIIIFCIIPLFNQNVFPRRIYSVQNEIDKLIKVGKMLYKSGEYEDAIIKFFEAMTKAETEDEHSLVYFNLSLTYYANGQIDKAEENLKNLFEIQPKKVINEKLYPPGFVKIFNETKLEFLESVRLTSENREMIELEITAWPYAKIILDGVEKRTVPPVLRETVYEGIHEVKFTIEDVTYGKYDERIEDLIVKKGQMNKVHSKFDPFGALEIVPVNLHDYSVVLDGVPLDDKPIKRLLKSGKHSLLIKTSSHQKKEDIIIEPFKINIFKVEVVDNKMKIKREIRDM